MKAPTTEAEVIRLRDKVLVVSTAKDPHHVTGKTFRLHPLQAKIAAKKGLVTIPGKDQDAEK